MLLPMSNLGNEAPKENSERATQRIANLALNMRSVHTTDKTKCLGSTFQPGPFDVICARGKSAFQHPGNQRFRSLIESRVEVYASTSNKYEKSMIVSKIVDEIRLASPGGGFVRSDKGVWYEVGDAAREKVSQSFRDLLHARYRSSKKAKTILKKGAAEKQEGGTLPRAHSDGEIQATAAPIPNQEVSVHTSGVAAMSHTGNHELGDLEPISYDAAMSLPPYPGFPYALPDQSSSSTVGQATYFPSLDLSLFLETMQGVRSSLDDTDTDNAASKPGSRRI